MGGGEGWEKETVRELGIDMYTLPYLKWITSMVLLYGTGNCAQCYGTAWIGSGVWGRMDACYERG